MHGCNGHDYASGSVTVSLLQVFWFENSILEKFQWEKQVL
jgi:hypothetical protein